MKAHLRVGGHDARESMVDVMLVRAAACRSVGEVAILEGEDPRSDVVPHSCHASIVSHVMVRGRLIIWVDVDMEEGPMSSEAASQR